MIEKHVIEINKEAYPKKLKIGGMPDKLYALGNTDLLYKSSFGIIGTRNESEYGSKICKFFTREIALRDIPVVSGLALGIDTIAHQTSLEYYGETIAVLGGGFKDIYPKENEKLFENIINNKGLVITEYSFNEMHKKENFPKRNRIVSALSDGILVIEAIYRSGTSITVKYAKKQGKKVFAIPRKIR